MSGIENVEVKEHKGNYGDTKNASANSLYKSYKSYVLSKKQQPLSFPEWISWAKEKGILPNTFKAEGVKEDVEESEVEKVAEAVGRSTKVVVTVVIASIALYLAYNLFTQTQDKPKS